MFKHPEAWARLLNATRGNQTLDGCIIIALMGMAPDNPPRFIYPNAMIDAHGIVRSHFQHRSGTVECYFPLGSVNDVVGNLRHLADRLKLPDNAREELFSELKKWISKDERAIQTDVLGASGLLKPKS